MFSQNRRFIPRLKRVGFLACPIIKGHRYKSEVGNSVTFWVEMCIVAAISIDLVYRFICMVR